MNQPERGFLFASDSATILLAKDWDQGILVLHGDVHGQRSLRGKVMVHGIGRIGSVAAFLAAAAVTSPAAGFSPNSVRKMDSEKIQTVSEKKLCDAYAVWLSRGKSYPVIDAELKRRAITCAEAVESVVSDCSMLKVVRIDTSDPRGTIYTVSNSSPKHKHFRIYRAGIQSSLFLVRPGATQDFGVAVDPRLARIGTVTSTLSGDSGIELNECVTARWGF